MDVKDYIFIKDEVLPWEHVSTLLQWFNKKEFEDAAIIGEEAKAEVDTSIRKTKILNLDCNSKSYTEIHWLNLLSKTFKNMLVQYEKHYGINLCLARLECVSALKYENSGFYRFHVDHYASIPRTMSCILLLNNDYEGGELVFGSPDEKEEILKVEVKPNRMIIWPSTFLYPHKVMPVTKGIRYSIVSWAL